MKISDQELNELRPLIETMTHVEWWKGQTTASAYANLMTRLDVARERRS